MKNLLFSKKMTFPIWLLLLLGLFASCVPQTKQTDCASNEAFNASIRKCVLITGSPSSTIYISSASPAQSYTTNISSASVPHNVTVSDSYAYGHIVKWKVSFTYNSTIVNNVTVATNVTSYTFNPNALYGVGSYVLEAIVFDSTGASQLNVKSWNITVSNLAVPTLVSPSPAGTAMSYTTATASATHTLFINNPDLQSGLYKWRVDGSAVSSGVFTGATPFLNYTFNPSLLPLGLHNVSLEINNGLSSVFDTYLWTVIVTNPNFPVIVATAPNYLNGVSVVNGISLLLGGYLNTSNVALTQFCVDVDNYDLNADTISDIDIKWEINGVSVDIGTFSSNQYCINSLPAINLVNPTIGESKDLKALVYKAGTTILVDYRSWSLSVRPKNIRPQITINSTLTSGALGCSPVGGGSTNVNYANCAMTQSTPVSVGNPAGFNNSMTFAFDIVDPDIGDPIVNSTQYSVLFKLQNQDLDGVISSYSASDCSYTLAEALGSAKMQCILKMDAFKNGPIAAGTYTLKAYIVDNGSTWTVTPEQSNEVSWTIAVSELQTANSIAISAQTNAVSPTLSYITRSDSACNDYNVITSANSAPNNAKENGYIQIHTRVRDEERDNFSITVDMENGASLGSYMTVVPTSIKYNTLSAEYFEVVSCVQIPEWAVWNQASSVVNLKVAVTDAPTNILLTQYSDIKTFQIFTENNNPAPAFTIATTPVALNAKVFAGFPFTIAAPAYTDASIVDGNTVTFKWRISVNGGASFTDIPNANSTNQASSQLVWTPSPFVADLGTAIQLQLCLGDNGYGNDVATCAVNKVYSAITAYPSVQQLAATKVLDPAFKTYSSGNDLASWFDATNNKLYVAYTAGTEIIVEKKQFGLNGELETAHSIRFDTEEPNKVSVAPSNLSITGIDSKSLFIAYSVASAPSSLPQMRVRRIDLANNKFGFHYVGFYNPTYGGIGSDLVTNSLTNTSAAAFGYSGMTLNFTGTPTTGDTIVLNGITITFGGNVINPAGLAFCTLAVNCGTLTTSDIAAAFYNVLTNSATDAEVREVLFPVYAGASSVDIYGPSASDYYDEINKTTPVIGKIMAKGAGTNEWYLPYANLTTSLALAVMHGTNADIDLSNSVNSHSAVSSSTFNQSIANTIDTAGNFIVVTKNSSGNADVYKLNSASPFAVMSSITSLFNLSGFDHVSKLSVSVGASNYIYTAGVSVTSGGATYLNAAIIDSANFTNKTVQPLFTLSNSLVTNVDQVEIVADPVTTGRATLAMTTEATVEARLGRITFNNASWANSIAFYNYESPKLNVNDTVLGGKIALTPIVSLTKGHANEALAVNTKDTVFFSFHENESGNNIIKAGLFNVTPTTITTNDTSVIGSYPANLK